jgi:hypothetical protein
MHSHIYRFFSYLLLSLGAGLLLVPLGTKLNALPALYCYGLSGILVLFGLGTIRPLYIIRKGVAVNPQWAVKAADGISVFFLSFAAYAVWAWVFNLFFAFKVYLYDADQPVLDMVAVFYLPAVLVVAFFASNFSMQSIAVDKEGIKLYYPGKVIGLIWKDIESLGLQEVFTVSGGEEWAASRELQTKLSLKTNRGDFTIYEPGLTKTKKMIVALMRQNAPERLQEDIAVLEREW